MRARGFRGWLGVAVAAACLGAGAAAGADPSTLPSLPGAGPEFAYVTGAGGSDSIWLADSGADVRRLGNGEAPLLSPDGVHVAAQRVGASGPALVVYGGARTFTHFDLRTTNVSPVGWSPDGRYLVVARYSTALNPRISQSGFSLLDTHTGQVQTIAYGYPCGASFAPSLPLRVVFGLAGSVSSCTPGLVNLYEEIAGIPTARQLTRDGRATNPVWGATGIAFTRLTARRGDYPTAEIWQLNNSGGGSHPLTHLHIGPLVSGLYGVGFSADGTHLLARFSGQDTEATWTLDLHGRHLRRLTVHGQSVLPGAISRDGRTILAAAGYPGEPPRSQTILTLPFAGGKPTVLVRRAGSPSWNR